MRTAFVGYVPLRHEEETVRIGPTGRDEYGPILYPPVPPRYIESAPVAKARDTSCVKGLGRSGSLEHTYWVWSLHALKRSER